MTQGSRDRYRCSFEMQSYLLGGELSKSVNQSGTRSERKWEVLANIIFAYHYICAINVGKLWPIISTPQIRELYGCHGSYDNNNRDHAKKENSM